MSGLITEKPSIVDWIPGHYYYVEAPATSNDIHTKAAAVWKKLHENLKKTDIIDYKSDEPRMISMVNDITATNGGIYRAGVLLTTKKDMTNTELKYTEFHGGQYWQFIVKGSYSNLGYAWDKVFDRIDLSKMRDPFCVEYYVNDPQSTPESDLETRILINKVKE